jgi:hypothetical protein
MQTWNAWYDWAGRQGLNGVQGLEGTKRWNKLYKRLKESPREKWESAMLDALIAQVNAEQALREANARVKQLQRERGVA